MEHQDRDALDGDGHHAGERETLIPVSTLESWTLSAGNSTFADGMSER